MIRAILCGRRDAQRTSADVLDMRRLMLAEFGRRGLWDIKRARGGLVEIEFIAQALQILHAAENPAILDQNTLGALSRLADAGLLAPSDHRCPEAGGPALQPPDPAAAPLRQRPFRPCLGSPRACVA